MRLSALLVTLTLLSCTYSGSSPQATSAIPDASRAASAQQLSCDKASISQVVRRFIHSWNVGDMTSLRSSMTSDANTNISTKMQGASVSGADAYTIASGWRHAGSPSDST
jgi:hypothetical protein